MRLVVEVARGRCPAQGRVVRRAVRRAGLLLVVVIAVVPLAACGDFSDAPPDPAVAPLEIVANDPAAGRCSLNRTDVAAGLHEVVVISEGVDAVVTVRDASGAVLLEQHGDTWPQAPAGEGTGGQEPVGGSTAAPARLTLSAGRYDVTCTYPDGVEGSTSLTVTP